MPATTRNLHHQRISDGHLLKISSLPPTLRPSDKKRGQNKNWRKTYDGSGQHQRHPKLDTCGKRDPSHNKQQDTSREPNRRVKTSARILLDFLSWASLVDTRGSCAPAQGTHVLCLLVVTLLFSPFGLHGLRFVEDYKFRARLGFFDYVSLSVSWVCTFNLSVLLEQEHGRHAWREGVFCRRLVVPGPVSSVRCPVSAWSCRHSVHELSPSLHMCMLRWTLRGRCSSCTSSDLSTDLIEKGRRPPMWTSGRSVCASENIPTGEGTGSTK